MRFLELISKYILKYKKFVICAILFFIVIAFFDKVLAVGILFIAFLTVITFLILKRIGFKTKRIYILFLIALLIHLGAVLFLYYADFQPFSGGAGDYSGYNSLAQEISTRLHQGDFSLDGLSIGHYYPIIIGYIYALTLPEILIGQMFNAWLVALLVVFVYLIVLEIGGTEKGAFFAGLIVSVYPSLLFYGSLLLKDALVVLLCSIILLLILKLLKAFSWGKFLIFYIFLSALFHFRIYIGFAALLCFIISWFLFSNLKLRKRLLYVLIMIIVLGFIPQISTGQGYYGINFMKTYLHRKTITYFRELLSAPNPKISPITESSVVYDEPSTSEPSTSESFTSEHIDESVDKPIIKRGVGSSVTVKTGFENPFTFVKNSLISFSYTLLGPFPWHLRYLRHLFIIPELILWYFSLFFIIKGIRKPDKAHVFTLVIFSLLVFGALSVFLTNFGITTRIRIPAFISLLCLVPFGFKRFLKDNIS